MCEETIQDVITNKGVVTVDKICLDEDHPPAEALGYAVTSIKKYLTKDAYKIVSSASMSI